MIKKASKKDTLKATTDPSEYSKADYIIIAVQTPVGDENKNPAYTNLKAALKSIGSAMKKDVTVIVGGRNIFEKESAMKAGFIYKGVGNV